MADGEIASLFATLGLRVNQGQWQQGNTQIRQVQTALGQISAGAGTLSKALGGVGGAADEAGKKGSSALSGFGSALSSTVQRAGLLAAGLSGVFVALGERVVRSGVEFNATLEDSKNKVAGLMALAKNTDFNDELANAGMLMEHLEKAAAKLPGETSQYVEMLSLIAQPVAQAKLGLKELEQLTISATSTALTMHIDPGQAARDIEGALNGVFNSRDRFTGPLLAARGFRGEEGRSRFNALDAGTRAKEVMAAFNAPQLQAMGAALGKSFSGVFSTMMDTWHQFERAIGKPLFERLGEQITKLNAWFEENKAKIGEVAEKIGGVLVKAFDLVVGAIKFFVTHATFAKSLLIAIGVVLAGLAIAWIAGFWPIFAVIAALTGLIYLIQKLMDYPGGIEQAFSDAFDAIGDVAADLWAAIKRGFKIAFDAIAELPIVKQLLWVLDQLTSFGMVNSSKEPANQQNTPEQQQANQQKMFEQQQDYVKSIMPGGSWLDAIPGIGDIARMRRLINGAPEFSPTLPRSGEGDAVSTAMNISVGDINVHSPNADPVAVGDQVRKVFHEELGNTIRKTLDVYG